MRRSSSSSPASRSRCPSVRWRRSGGGFSRCPSIRRRRSRRSRRRLSSTSRRSRRLGPARRGRALSSRPWLRLRLSPIASRPVVVVVHGASSMLTTRGCWKPSGTRAARGAYLSPSHPPPNEACSGVAPCVTAEPSSRAIARPAFPRPSTRAPHPPAGALAAPPK